MQGADASGLRFARFPHDPVGLKVEEELPPGASHIVRQRQRQQNRKKKEPGEDHDTRELFTRALDVHEEEHHQRGFYGGDEERHHRVEGTEIHKSNGRRRHRQDQKHNADADIKYLRVSRMFVFDHIDKVPETCENPGRLRRQV